ncbi:HAMP domain-containing sensor histidine kinase [Thalassotalea sp. SU-HH00458]|uniref:sensor histidine kinase n=1 Tax=Thalassotalea sp. SU-HH00458 TaxID=3127657 RepID=UPI003105F459
MMTSIKHRVFFYFGSFTVLLSLIFFGLLILMAYMVEDELIDKLLHTEAENIRQHYQANSTIISPSYQFMRLYSNNNQLPETVQARLKISPKATEIFTASDNHFHLTYISLNQETPHILLANVTPLLVVTNMSKNLSVVFTGVFCLFLLLAMFFAYKISKQTVKPVIDLAHQLKLQQQATETYQFPHYPFEIGYLSKTLEENLNKLQQALNREKHFTRDVSHELRTPLTVLKNAIALAEQRPLSQQDINHIKKANQDIENTINVLFMLARTSSMNMERCELNRMIEQAILDNYQTIEAHKMSINVAIDEQVFIQTNPHLFKLLMNNLINNAIEHSSEKLLNIEFKNNELTFSNALLSNVNEPESLFKSGVKNENSEGIGQGLFLIYRIVEVFNWSVNIQSQPQCFYISIKLKN